jgi:hypothetical protein
MLGPIHTSAEKGKQSLGAITGHPTQLFKLKPGLLSTRKEPLPRLGTLFPFGHQRGKKHPGDTILEQQDDPLLTPA